MMAKDLKKQAEELAQQMTENLARNDADRDAVDEADFRRSLDAEPFQGQKPAAKDKPSPFKKS